MSIQELFGRLRELELNFARLETKVTVGIAVLCAAGVIFWGVTSWFIYNKLEVIDASMDNISDLKTDSATNNLKFAHQEGFNESVIEQLQQQKQQIDRLNYELHSSNSSR